MNLISEIGKDARQFMRERRTLLLLIAAPLLVLFIISAIFNESLAQKGGAMGVCDLDRTNASTLLVNGIRNASEIQDYGIGSDCGTKLIRDVNGGRLSAGLIIPNGFEQGIQMGETQNITLILDNSRFQVSPTLEAFVKAAVQETDQKIGESFILSVWQKLNGASQDLGNLHGNINETRNRTAAMRARLNLTSESLKALNISGVRDDINLANNSTQETRATLSEAKDNLTQIESNFADYDQTLNETENDLVQINDSLANISGYIAGMKAGVNCSDPVSIAYCLSLDQLDAKVKNASQTVEIRLEKVHKARADLIAANLTIQIFKAKIDAAQNSTYEAEAKIADLNGFVDDLERNRNQAIQNIDEVKASLDEIDGNTYHLEDIISSSQKQIAEVTSRSPASVISPMLVSTNRIFGQRPFFNFMLPSLLPLIMMFIALFLASTSLVREKHGGTLTRIYAAQVNKFEFAAIKVISYTIVLIPEAILLALVASLLYNAFPIQDTNTWMMVMGTMVLLIFTFVAGGVLIAIHSDSESTAFLASLVIGLPLLFLSGLLFPFEFMPPVVALLGTLMPLSQAVIGMQSVILYQSPQMATSLALILYGSIFTLLAGASIRK